MLFFPGDAKVNSDSQGEWSNTLFLWNWFSNTLWQVPVPDQVYGEEKGFKAARSPWASCRIWPQAWGNASVGHGRPQRRSMELFASPWQILAASDAHDAPDGHFLCVCVCMCGCVIPFVFKLEVSALLILLVFFPPKLGLFYFSWPNSKPCLFFPFIMLV